MDKARFDELVGMKKSPKLYFIVTNLSFNDGCGWPNFPIVDGLMGKPFDFGSILRVVESSGYYSDLSDYEDGHSEVWVPVDEYDTKVPLDWVFEDEDEAKRARANIIYQFYSKGMLHCRVNEQII
jgi:hypothetical protein